MDVDVMTLEERSSLMKKGACFYCKERGHISKECPKKQNRNYGKPPIQKNEYKKYSKKDMATYVCGMTTEQKQDLTTELINDKDSNDEDF